MKIIRFELNCLWIVTTLLPIMCYGLISACDNTPYKLSQRILVLEHRPIVVVPNVMPSCLVGGKTR